MNPARSQFTQGFVSFFMNVLSLMPDSEAAAMALQPFSDKIGEWASSLMSFYFTSAIGIAVVSVQVKTELSLVLHFLYLSILLGFYSLLLVEFVRFKLTFPNHLLRCLGLFFLMLSFALAISIPFPLYFKLISFTLSLAALSLILWSTTIPAS